VQDILPRYVVRAAYAAGILHALEGWKHNDFSNEITTFLIDKTWEAASKHGFSVYSLADECTIVDKSSG
jgi:predicted amino acid dehydrogenase